MSGSTRKHSIGLDIVDVQAFTQQLQIPGSSFHNVFSQLELLDAREVSRLEGDPVREGTHLAGKWAAKEAFVKAWSNLLIGKQPPIERNSLVFAEVRVLKDLYQRAFIELVGVTLDKFESSLSANLAVDVRTANISTSISHDGDYATAVCSIFVNATAE